MVVDPFDEDEEGGVAGHRGQVGERCPVGGGKGSPVELVAGDGLDKGLGREVHGSRATGQVCLQRPQPSRSHEQGSDAVRGGQQVPDDEGTLGDEPVSDLVVGLRPETAQIPVLQGEVVSDARVVRVLDPDNPACRRAPARRTPEDERVSTTVRQGELGS